MRRVYSALLADHLQQHNQMIFLSGPRQVGKTTVGLELKVLTDHYAYLNWDDPDDRSAILAGTNAMLDYAKLQQASQQKGLLVLDELHKYSNWKNTVKGLFDKHKDQFHIIVTGSARLDVYKRGGDSLMGRYFPYRMYPFTLAELVRTHFEKARLIHAPLATLEADYQALLDFGGFPEPLLKRDEYFQNRWVKTRKQQLFREDLRDLTRIHDITQVELLAELLTKQASELVSYQSLANHVRVSVDTIKSWIKVLESFYYCFSIQPWSRNVTRSLLKQPKVFLWDWSGLSDVGARHENFIAVHLMKAVHFWNDCGFGDFGLYFLRDKEKREVDFVVTRDQRPWFLVEVKSTQNASLSSSLAVFQKQLDAPHAFQVAMDMPFVDKDSFDYHKPVIVSARTLLSQLI